MCAEACNDCRGTGTRCTLGVAYSRAGSTNDHTSSASHKVTGLCKVVLYVVFFTVGGGGGGAPNDGGRGW